MTELLEGPVGKPAETNRAETGEATSQWPEPWPEPTGGKTVDRQQFGNSSSKTKRSQPNLSKRNQRNQCSLNQLNQSLHNKSLRHLSRRSQNQHSQHPCRFLHNKSQCSRSQRQSPCSLSQQLKQTLKSLSQKPELNRKLLPKRSLNRLQRRSRAPSPAAAQGPLLE